MVALGRDLLGRSFKQLPLPLSALLFRLQEGLQGLKAGLQVGIPDFSAVGLGPIHRRCPRTTSEPSEEPSLVAELRRLGRPAVPVCLQTPSAPCA